MTENAASTHRKDSGLSVRVVGPAGGNATNLTIRPDPRGEGTGEEVMDLLLDVLELEEGGEGEKDAVAPRRNRSRSWKLRNVTKNRFVDPSQVLTRDDVDHEDTLEVVGTMVAGSRGR